MAKLVKSNEEPNTWNVLDDNCSIGGTVIGDRIVGGRRPITDNDMPSLGVVYFDGDDFLFIPDTESGVEHTPGHLWEIADLMDDLEAEKANAAKAGN